MTDATAALRRVMQGRVVVVGDPDYDELRRPWLRLVDQHPSVIVEAASVADVAATVRLSRDHRLELGIMSTGHGIAAPCDGGVLLHLGRLDAVEIDPEKCIARIGPGATSGDVLKIVEEHRLAFPTGQASNVGATGYILGGGIGWLMRKLGPASSSLLRATVVLADGSVVRASADDHPDLFWALRGGGGNFGVVVEVEVSLAPISEVHGGELFFPISRAPEVLRVWRDWTVGLGDDTTTAFRLMALPVASLPHFLHGLRACLIVVCHADPATAVAALEPLRALGKPLYQNMKDRPYSSMAGLDLSSHVSSSAGYGQSDYLRSLSDAVIDRLLAAADRHLPPLLQVEVQHLGGALAGSGCDGAFEPFDAPYLLHQVTEVNPLDPFQAVAKAADDFTDELRDDLTQSAYFNFLRWDEGGRVPCSFTPEKYDRLRTIKRRYDPENHFHLNLNIAPSGE